MRKATASVHIDQGILNMDDAIDPILHRLSMTLLAVAKRPAFRAGVENRREGEAIVGSSFARQLKEQSYSSEGGRGPGLRLEENIGTEGVGLWTEILEDKSGVFEAAEIGGRFEDAAGGEGVAEEEPADYKVRVRLKELSRAPAEQQRA